MEDMFIPPGFVFEPTDEVLLVHYLGSRCKDEALPCKLVFERDIYGVGNKAPWQIFTKKDPWIENTLYVVKGLIKVSKNGARTARIAGCGSWVQETGPKMIKDGKGEIIGYKKMLCFRINNESGVLKKDTEEEGTARKGGHWIMHEYSLGGDMAGKSTSSRSGEGEYVLCRITNKKHVKQGNIPVGVGSSTVDDHVDHIVQKPAKRGRTDSNFVEEVQQHIQMDSSNHVAPDPETEPRSIFTGLHCPFDCNGDLFENVSLITTEEGVPSGLFGSVPEMESFFDISEWKQLLEPNLSNTEILSSAEFLPRYQEIYQEMSNTFLSTQNSGFDAAAEPSLQISSSAFDNMHMHAQNLDHSFPQYGYGGEINLMQNKLWI